MSYDTIIAVSDPYVESHIEYVYCSDDCIVPCELDFYGVNEIPLRGAFESIEEGQHLGSIKGYLILTRLMKQMGDSMYKTCDDHSAELELIASILTDNGTRKFDSDVLYIKEENISDDMFNEIMEHLPKAVMKNYHSFPEYVVCYPKLEENKTELARFDRVDFVERGNSGLFYHVYDIDECT